MRETLETLLNHSGAILVTFVTDACETEKKIISTQSALWEWLVGAFYTQVKVSSTDNVPAVKGAACRLTTKRCLSNHLGVCSKCSVKSYSHPFGIIYD